jgi:alkylation response protein AidB-like acyl-CoA dehydrogenase
MIAPGEENPAISEAVCHLDRLAATFAETGCGVAPTQGSPSDADSREAYRHYGEAGLIGLHWPRAVGGAGHDPLVTFAVEEAMGYRWLPMSSYLLSVKTIGNALLQFATDELCRQVLPGITSGELIFCQGFSEPDAGSDLGSLRTTARVDGDHYIINGRKIWTSSAEYADWVYLAVRTGSNDQRHRGISVFIADMSTPGIEVIVHPTLGGGTLGELSLTDVVVPADHMVGELNSGWQVLMGTLDHERVTSEKVGVVLRLIDDMEPLVGDRVGRRVLAQLRGKAVTSRELGRRAIERLASGADASAESSMAKLSIALLMQELADRAVDILGPQVLVEHGPGALLDGKLAAFVRASVATTIAGGASDIQRKNIARRRVGTW